MTHRVIFSLDPLGRAGFKFRNLEIGPLTGTVAGEMVPIVEDEEEGGGISSYLNDASGLVGTAVCSAARLVEFVPWQVTKAFKGSSTLGTNNTSAGSSSGGFKTSKMLILSTPWSDLSSKLICTRPSP